MSNLDRRSLMISLTALLGACAAEPGKAAGRTPVVAMLGDSITAGYGVRPSEALPVALQRALAEQGATAEVVGFGVSGDTTGGGLSRVQQVIAAKPDLAVVALGANDIMQGVPPVRVEANLNRILDQFEAAGVRVVLAGLQAPPLLALIAPEWTGGYEAVFARVARQRNVVFHPSLLGAVALDPNLNQPDRLHPNASGVRRVAADLARTVAGALRAERLS